MKLSNFRFHDEAQVEGSHQAAPDTREQARRDQLLRLAMTSSWPEIPRSRLRFERHLIIDEATNELFNVCRGEVDAQYSPVCAYYVDESSAAVFLERHPGARTVEALEAKRAASEEARAERLRPRARR